MRNETKFSKSVQNYVYGRIPFLNFLNAGRVKEVYIQNGFSDQKILNALKANNVKPNYVDIRTLDCMSNNGNHQGVLAKVEPYKYSSLEEILHLAKSKKNALILILDEISDPHNFGAIIRTCDAFSVDGIIIKSKNQVPVNMTVSKVATGADSFVKIAMVNNLNNAIKDLKIEGFWVYAADGSGKDDYSKLKYDGPIALVMGSEGFGISKLTLENCDFIIKIPMTGHVNSLNVSVATGILLARIRN